MTKYDWLKTIWWMLFIVLAMWMLRTFLFTPVLVKGHSMDPTLHDGEHVITLKNQEIKRFDIITFLAPDEPGKSYIKRVIGLPGDTISYVNDHLIINGKTYNEPYLEKYKQELTDGENLTYNFSLVDVIGTHTIPEGTVFVMGDNRRISKDSRIIGVIDTKVITGDAKLIVWPPKSIGMLE